MQDVLTIGKRLVPLEQIAFVEPFDAARNPDFKPGKDFKARVVLLNREIILAETAPRQFAEAHGLRYLDEDDIAVNPAIDFKIEAFEATDSFKPEKAFQTRLKWRDRDGKEQSKLLVTKPEAVIAAVFRGGVASRTARKAPSKRPSASRASRRNNLKTEPAHS